MLANESIVGFISQPKCCLMQSNLTWKYSFMKTLQLFLSLRLYSVFADRNTASWLQTWHCICKVFSPVDRSRLFFDAVRANRSSWCLAGMNPEEIDSVLLRLQAGVDLAMQRAKAWSKYMKEITTYIEKKTQLGRLSLLHKKLLSQ